MGFLPFPAPENSSSLFFPSYYGCARVPLLGSSMRSSCGGGGTYLFPNIFIVLIVGFGAFLARGILGALPRANPLVGFV